MENKFATRPPRVDSRPADARSSSASLSFLWLFAEMPEPLVARRGASPDCFESARDNVSRTLRFAVDSARLGSAGEPTPGEPAEGEPLKLLMGEAMREDSIDQVAWLKDSPLRSTAASSLFLLPRVSFEERLLRRIAREPRFHAEAAVEDEGVRCEEGSVCGI